MSRTVAAIGILWLLCCRDAQTQEEYPAHKPAPVAADTLRRNFASIGCDKSYETFHWSGLTSYRNAFGPLSLQLNEQYLSAIILAGSPLITDNQLFDMHCSERLSDLLDASIRATSFILSDNRNIGISNASSHAVYGGVLLRPADGLSVEPMIGRRYDQQLDRRDQGTSYLLTITCDILRSSGYLANVDGSFQYDKLSPRTLETYGASVDVGKDFDNETRNDLRLVYSRNRRDFYLAADPDIMLQYNTYFNIETRADNSLTVTDSLEYGISRGSMLTAAGSVLTRQIDRSIRYHSLVDPVHTQQNTGISEFRMEALLRGDIRVSDALRTILTFGYSERDEEHRLQPESTLRQFDIDSLRRIEERKNNLSRRTTIGASVSAGVSSSDTVGLSGSGSILRYDTPSQDNTDDRDELWYVASLTTHHHPSRVLALYFTVDLSMTHLVYLFSQMSANNTWNRILRFAPKIDYSPIPQFRTENSFEVLANYTVYDFDYIASQTHSFVFRQFAFIDSSTIDLTRKLSLDAYSFLRFYERGELRWNDFAERPVDYFEDRTYIGTLRYAISHRLLFSLGIRYFSQMRYGFEGIDHVLVSSFRSVGPMGGIVLGVGSRTDLSLKGWYERQTQTGQPARGTTTLTMLLNVRI